MANLKTQVLTEKIFDILKDVRILEKDKRYKNFEYFKALKSHLAHSLGYLHELTIMEKSGNNVKIK